MTTEPTPEELRVFISEHIGWRYCGSDSCSRWYLSPKDAPLLDVTPKPYNEIDHRRRQLPSLDLEFMHEAEKVLTFEQRNQYGREVAVIIERGPGLIIRQTFDFMHATALQRALAFYKVIGGGK